MAQTVLSALYHDARFKSSADDNKPPVLETLHFLSAPDGAEAAIEEAPKVRAHEDTESGAADEQDERASGKRVGATCFRGC